MDFHGHTHTHTHTHTHRSVMIPLMFPLTDESVIGGGSSCLQLSESQWAASAARGRLIDYWFLSSLYSRSTTSVLKHRTKQNKQEIKAATEMLPPNWIFVFKSDGRADVLINSSCRSESRSLSAGESKGFNKGNFSEVEFMFNSVVFFELFCMNVRTQWFILAQSLSCRLHCIGFKMRPDCW